MCHSGKAGSQVELGNDKLGPTPQRFSRLLCMRADHLQLGIWPEHHVEDVAQSVWRSDRQRIVGLETDTNCMSREKRSSKCVVGAGQSSVRVTKLFLEPNMNAGLVDDFDTHPHRIWNMRQHLCLNDGFSLLRQISVEIRDIVVSNTLVRRPAGNGIPHGLIDGSRE